MSPSEREWFDDMVGPTCTELYRSIRDNLDGGRPIDLELFASHLLGMWQALPILPDVDLDPLEAFAGAVIRRARKRGSPEAYLLLCGLAAVAPPTLDRRARAGVRELSRHRKRVPTWVEQVGRVRFVDALALSDRYGDQTSVFVTFAHDGEPEHTLVTLVDHNLGGMVKDAFIIPGAPLSDVVAAWEGACDDPFHDEGDTVRERLDAAETARRLRPALDARSRYLDPPDSETMRDCAALLAARLRTLPKVEVPAPRSLAADERERLVRDFASSPEAAHLGAEADLAGHLIDFKCDDVDGDPLRWSPSLVEMCLLGWLPRHVTLEDDDVALLPDVLRAWVQFTGGVTGLPSELVETTRTWVGALEHDYRDAIDDPDTFGPAKTLLHAMRGDGIDPTDQTQIDAWIEDFNQRPEHDRRALLGHVS